MTRVATFGRSAVFAALAAAGWLPWLVVVGPALGARAALGLYLVVLTAAYLAGVAPRRASALRAALAAGLTGVLLIALARATGELALGLGVVLGLGRSAVLYRGGRRARSRRRRFSWAAASSSRARSPHPRRVA